MPSALRARDPGHWTPVRAGVVTLLLVMLLSGCGAGPAVDAGDTGIDERPENFLWVFGSLYRRPALYENLLAFAERHDLSIMLAPASVTQEPEAVASIRTALREAKSRGIPVLFNTGVFPERHGWPTAEEILASEDERRRYSDALKAMAGVYLAEYPGGRVIVGHEDPLFSNWPHDDEDNYRRYGAEMFMVQRAAVKAVDPDAQVGIFVLPSHTVEMYEAFMPVLAEAGALPDFNMIDKYRGYSDARVGIAETNRQTRHLLSEARRLTSGAPIYLLAQDHTINTGYTPSRGAITDHIDAALDAGVDGMGWYIRTRYVPTDSVSTLGGTVEPFLPLTGEVDEELYNTFTGDRDRFMFAYLATFERQGLIDPEARFDLWIHGTDLDLHEARLELRDAAGDWRYIGHIGTYVGGDNEYTLDGRTGAVVFRALERSTFPWVEGGSGPAVRIVADDSDDGLGIRGVYAMPYTPTPQFITAAGAAGALATDPEGVADHSLAHHAWAAERRLEPGETLTVDEE